jgi:hypothetical protein
MNVGVIIITARAHDARNAAYRLILPVPDRVTAAVTR